MAVDPPVRADNTYSLMATETAHQLRQRTGKKPPPDLYDSKLQPDEAKVTHFDRHRGPYSRNNHSVQTSSTLALSKFDRFAVITFGVLGMLTRFFVIATPNEVVFDEVHFGKFASFYLRGEYYFDVHPPLGKLLLALAGWFTGYDGHFLFTKIGLNYNDNNVSYVPLRAFPAIFGSMLVPLSYLIIRELGLSPISAVIAASLILFDNSLVTQSRLILLDSFLLFFMLMAVYSHIKFYNLRYEAFSRQWWKWLLSTGVFLGLTTSVKMVGLFVIGLIGVLVVADLWRLSDIRRGLSMKRIGQHFVARALCLILVPSILYLSFFYIHFSLLYKTGPGDKSMSPAFQMTLEGNHILTGSYPIRYGDVITISHVDTKGFLHSNSLNYPKKYDNGRISSGGQQVVAVHAKDAGSQWVVRSADSDTSVESDGAIAHVKDGDLIQLEHKTTNTLLMTHDVASPLTTTNMEFTTAQINDTQKHSKTIFRVEFTAKDIEGSIWKTNSTHFRLVNKEAEVALHSFKSTLPDWALKQQEVNGDRKHDRPGTEWVVRDIVDRDFSEDLQDQSPRKLGFFTKFWELQKAMIHHNSKLTKQHPFMSGPTWWPFMHKIIAFWSKRDIRSQIFLVPNAFGWMVAISSVVTVAALLLVEAYAGLRGVQMFPPVARTRIVHVGQFLLLCWAFHYAPFFLMGRSLYLHHYLPALLFSYLITALLFQVLFVRGVEPTSQAHQYATKYRLVGILVGAAIVLIQLYVFIYFAPITYGHQALQVEQVRARQWFPSWNLHHAK
ncbi:O-mannosyltransferase [Basidiobolus meristosporus CBS 931.73]|uniref:Dolichyl-phosphate-mannose--protein mannosyltransferase n=1 Tax=Basidiobolus meristosporus CBS 931.73 TaxID=1314790 RepID=A0A1Y1YJR3_9FUNG|nr:O-mannosyltransferase [Basidiobolus meristosporus CBS 931.73]|eukprot:ORX98235.1 O-mannosyltransferase [Basidiobolus meristosporus CBS 931.73]